MFLYIAKVYKKLMNFTSGVYKNVFYIGNLDKKSLTCYTYYPRNCIRLFEKLRQSRWNTTIRSYYYHHTPYISVFFSVFVSQKLFFCVLESETTIRMTAEEYQQAVTELQRELEKVAERYLPCSDESDDVVQETLLRLWQMHDQLHLPVLPFAKAIVKNLCLDKLRRSHHFDDIDSIHTMPSEDDPPDERIERMMHIIDTLPSLQQTVLRLRHLEGMEFKDIAKITGMSETAIRKAVSRARQSVRDIYLLKYNKED